MPEDAWSELLSLLRCGAILAAAVLPIVAVCAWWSRRRGTLVWPRVRPWPVPWSGMDVSLLLVAVVLLPPVVAEALAQSPLFEQFYGQPLLRGAEAPTEPAAASLAGTAAANLVQQQLTQRQTVLSLWAGLISLPMQIGIILTLRRALYPTWRNPVTMSVKHLPARIALAGSTWLVLTPLVFLTHFAAGYLALKLGAAPEDHPLTKLGIGSWRIDRLLFVLQACVIAPVIEEWACRGILLPWAVRRGLRFWLTTATAIAVAGLLGSTGETLVSRGGSAAFLTIVLIVGGLVSLVVRSPRGQVRLRRWGGVTASAAIFAALHASVWPSPIPLFALGLGLGWLALVTRGLLVPVLVHSLFNAISVLFVLS